MNVRGEMEHFMANEAKKEPMRDERLRCSWCRNRMPTPKERKSADAPVLELCLCEDKWLPHPPPLPPAPPKPVKG